MSGTDRGGGRSRRSDGSRAARSHELSNPLVGLLGSAELALAEAEPGTKLHGRIAADAADGR